MFTIQVADTQAKSIKPIYLSVTLDILDWYWIEADIASKFIGNKIQVPILNLHSKPILNPLFISLSIQTKI